MLKQDKIINHKLNNLVQTVLLFGGMLLLLALIGSAIAGTTGLWWAMVLGLLFLLFGQQVSPQWVLRAQRARPLMSYEAPALFQLVQALAQRAKLTSSPRLYYIPQEMPNAFTVGSGDGAVTHLLVGYLADDCCPYA